MVSRSLSVRSLALLILLPCLVLLAAGCSDAGTAGGSQVPIGALTLETLVVPGTAKVGETVEVRCEATTADGATVGVGFTRRILPAAAGTYSGKVLTLHTPGVHEVACGLEGRNPADTRWDETPATVTVTTEGGIASIETAVDPGQIAAGGEAVVTCTALDANGDAVPAATVVVADGGEGEGVAVSGGTVVATAAGKHEVACALADGTLADATPSELLVTPGPATTTLAHVSPDHVTAGESATVTCEVRDAYGNVHEGAPAVAEASDPAAVTIVGSLATGKKAGTYEIACLSPGVPAEGRVPATLVVLTGAPASLAIFAGPAKTFYAPGDVVEVWATMVDAFGNPTGPATLPVIPPPSGVEAKGGDEYKLLADGDLVFTALSPADGLEATKTLTVDGGAPVVVITAPERGATLSGFAAVKVEGEVHDAVSGVASLEVSGYPVVPAADGTFEVTLPAVHSLNLLVAVATDAAGNSSDTTAAFSWSSDWQEFDPAAPAASALHEALRVWLGQESLDDGDHDPAHVDDLATVVEIVLSEMDLGALGIDGTLWEKVEAGVLDLPIVQSGVWQLTLEGDAVFSAGVKDVDFGTPAISLTARQGGILLEGTIASAGGVPAVTVLLDVLAELPVDVHGEAPNPLFELGLSSEPTMTWDETVTPFAELVASVEIDTLSFTIDLDVSKSAGAPLQVAVKTLEVEVGTIALDPIQSVVVDFGEIVVPVVGETIDLGLWDLSDLVGDLDATLADGLLEPVANAVVDLATAYLLPFVKDQVAPLVAGFLESIAISKDLVLPSLLPSSAGVPASPAPAKTVHFEASLDTVAFEPGGGMLGLAASALSEKAVDRDPLGSILRDGCGGKDAGVFAFSKADPLQVGVGVDLVNQLLHAAWWTGALDLEVGPETLAGLDLSKSGLPITLSKVTTSFLLPPVLSDCNSKGLVFAQVGDLRVDADFVLGKTATHLTAYVTAEAEVVPGVTGDDVLTIAFGGLQTVSVDVVAASPNADSAAVFEELVKEALLPMLLGDLAGKTLAELPVPSFDLSSFAAWLPEGTTLAPAGLTLVHAKGVFGLSGHLE